MTLKKDDITYIANLAHLEITDEEKDIYFEQLQSVFHHIDKLSKCDVDAEVPTVHNVEVETPLREDVVIPYPDLDLLKNAPDWEGHGFKVPKIR